MGPAASTTAKNGGKTARREAKVTFMILRMLMMPPSRVGNARRRNKIEKTFLQLDQSLCAYRMCGYACVAVGNAAHMQIREVYLLRGLGHR